MSGPADAPDFDELSDYFRALAYGTRLELLHLLRFPTVAQDIRLTARQVRSGQSAERPASRQAIQEHLDKLTELGIVIVEEDEGGRKQYRVNGARLYQITEEFRKVGAIMAHSVPAGEVTVGAGAPQPARPEPGPKLVLVHGMLEGKAFPLRREDLADGRGWIVGRKAGLHASLEYDPFVSLENAEVLLQDGQFVVRDLPSSRNGTMLNWRRLAPDVAAPLEPGDVIGVGRSLLVFKAR